MTKQENYFLVWCDYDGTHVEPFVLDDSEQFEARLTEIMLKANRDTNGTEVLLVAKGCELDYAPHEVVTRWRVKE